MQQSRASSVALLAAAVLLGVIMITPQWLHQLHPMARGFPVELNSDEDLYLSHVQQSLAGQPEEAGEAITGDPAVVPLQGALIEEWEGRLLRWTGLDAAHVFWVLDGVIPPLLFLALFWFLRLSGFAHWQALTGAGLFSVLELYNLNRPVHQRESFLLVLLSLIGLLEGVRRRRWAGVLGGALLGLLVGVYFWSWTFAWVWAGLVFLCAMFDAMRTHHPASSPWKRFVGKILHQQHEVSEWRWLLLFILIGALVAMPFVLQMVVLGAHPLAASVRERIELLSSHRPESWIRSLLFLGMTLGVTGACLMRPELWKQYRYCVITVLAAFVVLNQQVLHGVTFLFSSHYLFPLVMAGVLAFLLSFKEWRSSRWFILSGITSFVFLLGIAYDGRHIFGQWMINPARFEEQHLASAMPVLGAMSRTTILSDDATMRLLASHTVHDVPYSVRLNYMLISEAALAERYCLSKIASPPSSWKIEAEPVLIYDPDQIERDPPKRTRELTLVGETCTRMAHDPFPYLKTYGIRFILWDEARHPEWDLQRLRAPLTKTTGGEGWSLWKI